MREAGVSQGCKTQGPAGLGCFHEPSTEVTGGTRVGSAGPQGSPASRLFLPGGLFGNAGPRLLLGSRQLDVAGVLQGCLRGERLRSVLEETHL